MGRSAQCWNGFFMLLPPRSHCTRSSPSCFLLGGRGASPEQVGDHLRHLRHVLHVHLGLHFLHLLLGLWVLHHLGQHCDEEQRHDHHHQHRIEEHVRHLPLFPLLEIAELAQWLGLDRVGKLGYLIGLNRIVFPGPVFSLGVDVHPYLLIHVVRVLHFYKECPRGDTLKDKGVVFLQEGPPLPPVQCHCGHCQPVGRLHIRRSDLAFDFVTAYTNTFALLLPIHQAGHQHHHQGKGGQIHFLRCTE